MGRCWRAGSPLTVFGDWIGTPPGGPLSAALLIASGAGASLATWVSVRRSSRRLTTFTRWLERRADAARVHAEREVKASERERQLTFALARKTAELEQRVAQQSLLFDVLRESAASHDIESVLESLTERLGRALELRDLAVLLRDHNELVVRAWWGSSDPSGVLGRRVQLDAFARGLHADIASAASLLWGGGSRRDAFVSVPIRFHGEVIGVIALTRELANPLSEHEMVFLEAIADQVAIAIRSAQLFAELAQSATHDALTGLPNRRLFGERMDRALTEARRYELPLSVLVVDIDHFKHLNDRYGHPAGDAALCEVASTLAVNVRASDTVARVGGEEFAVILSRADLEEALAVGEKLRLAIAAIQAPYAEAQPLGHLSVSVGAAQLTSSDEMSSLLARADRALYAAKAQGRNRVVGGHE